MKSLFKAGARGVERITMISEVRYPTSFDDGPRNRVKHAQNSG